MTQRHAPTPSAPVYRIEFFCALYALVVLSGGIIYVLFSTYIPTRHATGGVDSVYDNANFIIQLFNYAGYLTIAFLVLKRLRHIMSALIRCPDLLALSAWFFLSFLWSADIRANASFITTFIISALFGVYLAVSYSPKHLIKLLSYFFIFILLASYFLVLFTATQGLHYTSNEWVWAGTFYNRNQTAAFFSIAGLFFVCLVMINPLKRIDRFYYGLLAAASFLFLIQTDSTTMPVIFIILSPLLASFLLSDFLRPHYTIIILALNVLLSAVSLVLLYYFYEDLLKLFGKNTTFTGRTFRWLSAWEYFLESPLIGHGGAPFTMFENSQLAVGAHNTYLELSTRYGIIGLILYLVWLGAGYLFNIVRYFHLKFREHATSPLLIFFLCLMPVLVLHGISEGTLLSGFFTMLMGAARVYSLKAPLPLKN